MIFGNDASYGFLGMIEIDKMLTHYIQTVLEGDKSSNATAYAYTPNGTQYAVCTTLQYFGYNPASNATWLTVEPQSTQVMRATKTPEQMQREAEQSG